jgi:hypothetical protein
VTETSASFYSFGCGYLCGGLGTAFNVAHALDKRMDRNLLRWCR